MNFHSNRLWLKSQATELFSIVLHASVKSTLEDCAEHTHAVFKKNVNTFSPDYSHHCQNRIMWNRSGTVFG